MVTLSILVNAIIMGKKTVKLFYISANYHTQINVECFKLVSAQRVVMHNMQ